MKVQRWIPLWLLLFVSCCTTVGHKDGETIVHRGPIDWVERTLGDRTPPLSVTAELDFSEGQPLAPTATGVICRTLQGHLATHYMIYERRPAEASWGVYALVDGKNGISMPLPFDPNSIRYEDRSARQILVQFLVERGATQAEAEEFLAGAVPKLFAEGLRVILALDEARAPDVVSQFLQGSDDPFVLSIELEQLEY